MFSHKITIGLAALTVLLLGAYIYFATTLTSLVFKLENEEQRITLLQEKIGGLTVELASRQSPEYILSRSEELGLIEIRSDGEFIDARQAGISRVGN